MVLRRAFSFTDDSANVRPEICSSERIFSSALEPAQQLLRLRQLQSATYQQLHLSDRWTLESPWPEISMSLNEMRLWAENLPETITRSLKWLFLSELNYGYILILCAPNVARESYNYANAKIFDYAVKYTENTFSLIQTTEQSALYTSHDVLRASYVGDRLLDILDAGITHLFTSVPPAPPILPSGFSPLPFVPRRSVDELIDQALSCLDRLDRVLEHLCVRYGYPEPLNEFRQRSMGTSRVLHTRRGAYNMPAQQELGVGSTHVSQEKRRTISVQPGIGDPDRTLPWGTIDHSEPHSHGMDLQSFGSTQRYRRYNEHQGGRT